MKECTVGKSLKDIEKSVAIGRLERFVADWERENGLMEIPAVKAETGKKVGIIGTGPAGLTVAADIRREGHGVVLFEAFHKPGGVMVYGIPEFRLPKAIVQKEIDALTEMGCELKPNFVIGRTRKIPDLLEEDGFDALFITAAELIEELTVAAEQGRMQEALKRYIGPAVLVIDEVGYLSLRQNAANVLYHVVNRRYLRQKPMLFTTNKPLTEWGEVLHDPDLAAAILDRVLHRGRLLILDGPSIRNQKPLTGPKAGDPSAIFSGTSVPDLTEPTRRTSNFPITGWRCIGSRWRWRCKPSRSQRGCLGDTEEWQIRC